MRHVCRFLPTTKFNSQNSNAIIVVVVVMISINSTTRILFLFAVVYRLCILSLSLLSNAVVIDYDTSTRVLLETATTAAASASSSSPSSLSLLPTVHLDNDTLSSSYSETLLGTWSRWDAVYFLRIAQMGGYEYEHFHAFFPLYPFLCRWTAVAISKCYGAHHHIIRSFNSIHHALIFNSL